MARVAFPIPLDAQTRNTLDKFIHSSSTPQSLALRCRIVLAAAGGPNNRQIAAALKIPPITVGKWRRSFALNGLEGLRDAPRSGRPPRHDADTRHRVQTRVVPVAGGSRPVDRAHTRRRSRSKKYGENPTPFTWTKASNQGNGKSTQIL